MDYGVVKMPWKGLMCLLIVALGFVLFFFGANYYDGTVGWTGVGLIIVGIILYALLKLLESMKEK